MLTIKSAASDLIHLFFPHVCSGCGYDIIDTKQQLCLRCISELPVTNFFDQPGNPIERNFYGRMNVKSAGSAYFFTKNSLIESLIYELKYKGNKPIGLYMGEKLGNILAASHRFDDVDIVIPLPLNAKRLKKRGYNQSQLLCEGLQITFKKPVISSAVMRRVNTSTQTHMGRISRWENMDGVFTVVLPDVLKNKHILLVDDVVTTGASLEACGKEILKVEGTTISVATLAYTI